ncbi:hypothetical protein STEG23_033759 [Scotinomys teguina]
MGNENSVQGVWEGGLAMERCHQETCKGQLLTGKKIIITYVYVTGGECVHLSVIHIEAKRNYTMQSAAQNQSFLSGLFHLGSWGQERRLTHQPFVSLILNYEPAVIDTTAKDASLLIAASSSTGHGHQ